MTTTTLVSAAPVANDPQFGEAAQEARSDVGLSRGLWRLQLLFLALGMVIDFVAFSAALQLLDSQMAQWQARLIAACGGALALFLMFEAGHAEAGRRVRTKGRHGRGLILVLVVVWLLAGVAATCIRVTTATEGSGTGPFESTSDSAGWDIGLLTVYPEALPMALFMFVLYLGVGISAYIAGLTFEQHRQPSNWLTRRRDRRTVARQRKAQAAERERSERAEAAERDRLERNLADELERLEQLHAQRENLTARLSRLETVRGELAASDEALGVRVDLEAALVSLEEARAVRQVRADEHVSDQQHAASLRSHLQELPDQIDREKRAAHERGRYASEHARHILSRGLADPAKTVMAIDGSADEHPTEDARKTQ